MVDRILSLMDHLSSRPSRTNDAPNSWANVATWRRYFDHKDELFEQMIFEAIDERFNTETMSPVVADVHSDQRRLETRKAHQDSTRLTTPLQGPPVGDLLTRSTLPVVGDIRVTTPGSARHPAVHVPVGEDPARYMPQ